MTDHRSLIAHARAAVSADEAAAHDATPGPWTVKQCPGTESTSYAVKAGAWTVAYMPDRWSRGSAASHPHIARHDPTRVLVRCAHDRALLDAYETAVTAKEATDAYDPDDRDGDDEDGLDELNSAALSATVEAFAMAAEGIAGGPR
jgi:hypothetical protein